MNLASWPDRTEWHGRGLPIDPLLGIDAVDQMRRIAYETVLRACGFGSLAIFCIMVGLSFNPLVAFQTGGVLTMLMTGILVLKALEAQTRPYRRTEMWLYLPQDCRPPPGSAQQLTSTLMREVYFTCALWTSMVGAGIWALALVFSFLDR